MSLLDTLSLTAVASTVGLFLCGIPICRNIAAKRSTEKTPAAPFVLGTIGCFFWLRYGLLKADKTILTVNGIGFVLEVFYLGFFYVYTRNKTSIRRQILTIIVMSVCMVYYIYAYAVVLDVQISHLGMMCVVFNILNFAAPMAGLRDVIRSQSTEDLPLPLCAANLIVSAQWLLYGVIVNDIYIKFPNLVGIVLATIQLSLFVIYPRRKRV